uniref:Orf173 n=1 Tax=Cereibacter sphaeroides TaxID=1063 RepID=Q9RFF7_CERSP|nr:Orf173 [Cereibacter sphaeroides]
MPPRQSPTARRCAAPRRARQSGSPSTQVRSRRRLPPASSVQGAPSRVRITRGTGSPGATASRCRSASVWHSVTPRGSAALAIFSTNAPRGVASRKFWSRSEVRGRAVPSSPKWVRASPWASVSVKAGRGALRREPIGRADWGTGGLLADVARIMGEPPAEEKHSREVFTLPDP